MIGPWTPYGANPAFTYHSMWFMAITDKKTEQLIICDRGDVIIIISMYIIHQIYMYCTYISICLSLVHCSTQAS